MTVLVTGATGNVGSAVVRELLERGEPVFGDFAAPASVRRALEGVHRLFLSSGDGPLKVGHETAVIDAAAAAGLELVVKASTLGADAASPLPGLAYNGRIEDHLRASGLPAVNLRSSFYMTNLLAAAEQVRATGTL